MDCDSLCKKMLGFLSLIISEIKFFELVTPPPVGLDAAKSYNILNSFDAMSLSTQTTQFWYFS